jgi:hypothetical protein
MEKKIGKRLPYGNTNFEKLRTENGHGQSHQRLSPCGPAGPYLP